MIRFSLLTIWVLAAGCGKDSKTTSTGSAGGAPEPSATQPSGDCTSIAICDAFPSAHVDSMCGTKVAKTTVQHVDSTYITDACTYMNPNGSTAFEIGRVCMTKAGGGADAAKQMFQLQRADMKKTSDVTDMPGLGDEAYYLKNRNSQQNGLLNVRKGNVLTSISHAELTPATEDAMKTKCLVALYNELAAK
jgi:hypothetical protein